MARRASSVEPKEHRPVLPVELHRSLSGLLGTEVIALEQALQVPPPISLRLNPAKPSAATGGSIPWCTTGRYLSERPSFTFDPLLHAGAYYVQEASSMFLEQALLASGLADLDLLALDLCAAPGGKTTHLRSLLTRGSLLVANEVDGARRNALAENLWKWGAGNAMITGSDPSDLEQLQDRFDLIVLDAPCSGEGMFRKDPFAREQWSPALVERCAATQRRIVEHAWNALAPGGVLIYSTCTWEVSEDEDQLRPLIERGGESITIPIDPTWGIERTDQDMVTGYRCYPHRLKGEGFFLGMVRKPGSIGERTVKRSSTSSEQISWLNQPDASVVIEHRDVLHALDAQWEVEQEELSNALRIAAPGTPFAERKGNEWRPHAASALSDRLDRSAFPEVELDEATAIRYLQGHVIPGTKAQGSALVTYKGHPLGWAQGAGSRWNNRWPQPWRIRAQQPGAPRVSWADA